MAGGRWRLNEQWLCCEKNDIVRKNDPIFHGRKRRCGAAQVSTDRRGGRELTVTIRCSDDSNLAVDNFWSLLDQARGKSVQRGHGDDGGEEAENGSLHRDGISQFRLRVRACGGLWRGYEFRIGVSSSFCWVYRSHEQANAVSARANLFRVRSAFSAGGVGERQNSSELDIGEWIICLVRDVSRRSEKTLL